MVVQFIQPTMETAVIPTSSISTTETCVKTAVSVYATVRVRGVLMGKRPLPPFLISAILIFVETAVGVAATVRVRGVLMGKRPFFPFLISTIVIFIETAVGIYAAVIFVNLTNLYKKITTKAQRPQRKTRKSSCSSSLCGPICYW